MLEVEVGWHQWTPAEAIVPLPQGESEEAGARCFFLGPLYLVLLFRKMLRVYLPPSINPEACLLCGQAFLLTVKNDHTMQEEEWRVGP